MSADATIQDVLEGRARWTLFHGSNREAMAQIPAAGVDHVITDPPYAARAMKNARSANSIKQRRDGKVYDFGYSALTPRQRREQASEYGRVARGWVLVWCDIESDHAWRVRLQRAGLRYVRTSVWLRECGAPQFSGDRPAQDVEACVIAHAAGRLGWNGGGRGASQAGPIVNGQSPDRIHSSPKPLWLMLKQIEDFTDPDDVVIDPYAGSATTGVACLRLGRRFIGCEISPDYYRDARDRLAAESHGLGLVDFRAGQRSLFGEKETEP